METKEKSLGSVTCPKCKALMEIVEKELISQVYRKKESTKTLEARLPEQATLFSEN